MVQHMIKKVAKLGSDQQGQNFIEYALIVGLAATAAAAISPAIAATAAHFGSAMSALAGVLAVTAGQ